MEEQEAEWKAIWLATGCYRNSSLRLLDLERRMGSSDIRRSSMKEISRTLCLKTTLYTANLRT